MKNEFVVILICLALAFVWIKRDKLFADEKPSKTVVPAKVDPPKPDKIGSTGSPISQAQPQSQQQSQVQQSQQCVDNQCVVPKAVPKSNVQSNQPKYYYQKVGRRLRLMKW